MATRAESRKAILSSSDMRFQSNEILGVDDLVPSGRTQSMR